MEQRHRDQFREGLIGWFVENRREMPWRSPEASLKRDPYHVWVSEVMLQQTRVDQVRPYFERFVEAFPTIRDLAEAELDAVLKCWEGLGYYTRARNLHTSASLIVKEFGGSMPDDEASLRSLPGIGAYTAAAVLSIAFNKPLAVLDGNVIRVLSRVFGIEQDVRSSATRRALQSVADSLLDRKRPGLFNEALMELGATICTPRNPRCTACPLSSECFAFAADRMSDFPVAAKRKPTPHYEIAVGVVTDSRGCVLIQKRPQQAMLGGLWEFPGGKREADETLRETCRRELEEELGIDIEVGDEIARIKHAYSHFSITLAAFDCSLVSGKPAHHTGQEIRWIHIENLAEFAFPRASQKVIEVLVANANVVVGGTPHENIVAP